MSKNQVFKPQDKLIGRVEVPIRMPKDEGAPPKEDLSSALDRARQERLTDAIALGATIALACKYAGLNTKTYYVWKERYPEFGEAVAAAEGRGLVGWLTKIEDAANAGSWQAAAWKLERRYPETYGRQVQDQRSVQLTMTAEQLENISDADLDLALKRALARNGEETS